MNQKSASLKYEEIELDINSLDSVATTLKDTFTKAEATIFSVDRYWNSDASDAFQAELLKLKKALEPAYSDLLGIIIFTVILVIVMIACLLDAIPPKQGAVFKVTQVNRKMINNVESKYVNAINEQNMQALYGVQYTSDIPVQAGDYVIIAHPFASKSKVKAYPSR